MVLYGSTIPESKRFFKISELAGRRWPTVTEDEIYNWHDAGYKIPITTEGFPPLIDTTALNMWNDFPHRGEINLMAYWVFFPEFHTLPSTSPEAILELFEKNHFVDRALIDLYKKMTNESPELFNVELLSNSFFMIETDCSKGFAFNSRGFIDCWEFYSEQGILCPSRCFDEKAKRWVTNEMRIKKEDLLIKVSSVQFLEQIAPELTSADRRSKDGGIFQAAPKDGLLAHGGDKKAYVPAPGEEVLESWKAIAAYAKVHESTAKRNFKGIVGFTPAGKALTTTARLDAYRVNTATKKNRRKKG